MPDYETLYHLLVAAADDAVSAIEAQNYGAARNRLIAAEQFAEECVIAEADAPKKTKDTV